MALISKKSFGKTSDGKEVFSYTLKNFSGSEVEVISYGGAIRSIKVPDRNGKLCDVALGFDSVQDYEKQTFFMGALIGRCSNRIENSEFELNGKIYKLNPNEGQNHLHGGIKGFDKVIWECAEEDGALVLSYFSQNGEENYPGNLKVKVVYSLSDKNELKIDYTAVCDEDTICNLTNHAYFNLSGHDSGSILEHSLKLHAKSYTPADEKSLPTGEIAAVEGTPLDFTEFHVIGERIDADFDQLKYAKGYDHNWIVNGDGFRLAAELFSEKTGIVMNTYTDLPGIQFYSGNYINGKPTGKDGAVYGFRSGLCLETQFFPNSMKHKNFPSPVLKKGETYHSITVYEFKTK
jgi:aldose 1-epimerase